MAAGNRDLTAGTLTARPASFTLNPFQIKQTINFNDAVILKGGALEAADVLQAIKVPANTFVLRVLVKVITPAEGTTLTANIGDGSNDDGYDVAIDLKAAAGTITTSGLTLTEGTPNALVDAYAAGVAYTAEDTIDVKIGTITAVTVLPVIEVTAVCIQL